MVVEPRVWYAGKDEEVVSAIASFKLSSFKPGDKVEVTVRSRK